MNTKITQNTRDDVYNTGKVRREKMQMQQGTDTCAIKEIAHWQRRYEEIGGAHSAYPCCLSLGIENSKCNGSGAQVDPISNGIEGTT